MRHQSTQLFTNDPRVSMSPFVIILYAMSLSCFVAVPLMIYQRDEKIDRWIMAATGLVFLALGITAHELIPTSPSSS